MKKLVRLLVIAAAIAAVLLLVLVGVAMTSRFQTWAARKALASQPELKVQLGSVSAGLRKVELRDVHAEQDGAIVTLPSLSAELSTFDAGVNQKINLRRLVAKGWTIDLTRYKFPSAAPSKTAGAPRRREFSLLASAYAADPALPAAAVTQVFQGVFAQAKLPVELSLDGVELEGDVLLPPAPGIAAARAHLVFTGGGLAAGREGAFDFSVAVALSGADVPVNSLNVSGRFTATMDTPRTFSRLGTKVDASAKGPQFPGGVKLSANVSAAHAGQSESYGISLAADRGQLVAIQAELPEGTHRLGGTWKLDLRAADLAPFALGRPLPVFEAMGEGRFDTDPAFAELHASGRLTGNADKLDVVKPELAAIGALKLSAEFDVAHSRDSIRVDRLVVALEGARPVVAVQGLQAFEFNLKTGDLKVADPARDLVGISLQGLPLAWAKPFLKDLVITGGDARGELAVGARNGGLTLRSREPLVIAGVSAVQAGAPLVRALDLSLTVSGDYTPQGWQAELAPFTVNSGGATLLSLAAKAGKLAGKDQPLKATGKFSTNLPAVLAQPVAASFTGVLVKGVAGGEFTASVDARQQYALRLALSDLVADPKLTAEKLPSITADLRADIAADGKITLAAPLLFERDGRKSDLALDGTLSPGKTGLTIDAKIASTQLFIEDVQVLAAPFSRPSASAAAATSVKPAGRDATPFWTGVGGSATFALKKVVYAQKFEISDVGGAVQIDAGELKLDGVRAGLGDGSDAKLGGGVTFDAKSDTPYALTANLALNNFDTAPLFRALNPGQPPTVEGKFTVTSQLAGRARNAGEFAERTRGDFNLTSKSGVFRGLPTNISAKVESAGKLASGVAFVGSLLGGGKNDKAIADVANKAQAVAEVSKLLSAIQYDQLNIVVSRDAALNTLLKDFTLIAPELRLEGGGQVLYRQDASLLEQPLAMQFKLRTRGRTADLMKFIGVLEAKTDELGYTACNLPLNVTGTLGKPDTTELQNAFGQLALERSGALDLLNRIMPGGK